MHFSNPYSNAGGGVDIIITTLLVQTQSGNLSRVLQLVRVTLSVRHDSIRLRHPCIFLCAVATFVILAPCTEITNPSPGGRDGWEILCVFG